MLNKLSLDNKFGNKI